MTLIPPRRRLSRAQKLTISLFALGLISWLVLPASVWNNIEPTARAASFTVNTLADTPDVAPGNGTCADSAGACSLRAAIQEANAFFGNDTINFSVTGTINLTGALPNLTTTITINGPGSALLTIRRDTGGDYRIFANSSVVSVSGLTVTNGRTPEGTPSSTFFAGTSGSGGGIYNQGNLTLIDVVVTANSTGIGGAGSGGASGGRSGNGGGISNDGNLTLSDVVVTGNSTGNGGPSAGSGIGGTSGSGGGIDSTGSLTMIDVVVSNNTTGNGATAFTNGTSGSGGGVYFNGNTLNMTNVVISGNTCGNSGVSTSGGLGGDAGSGGGMYALKGTLTLSKVTLSGNSAGNGYIGGMAGGLFLWADATTTMIDCSISNNSSGQGSNHFASHGGFGGGMVNLGSTRMVGCLVNGNSTKGQGSPLGGGIYNGNTLNMTNCTVSGNIAEPNSGRGGGIFNRTNGLTLTNVTITGNKAYTCCRFENGQGIHSEGVTTVSNTIIAENNPGVVPGVGGGPVPDATGTFNSLGHNLIGRATSGGDGSDADQTGFTHGVNVDQVGGVSAPINPQLGSLADNGGPTLTHALLLGSPALDAGNNSLAKDASNNTLTTDQRGVGRFADSDDPDSTATVDIGAFEFHQSLEDVSDKTTNEDTPLIFSFAVGGSGAGVTSVEASSDNQALVPDANLSLTGAHGVRTLQITPLANQSGTAQITLTVVYAGGPIVNDTFQLTVTSVNDVPSFTKGGDQTVNEDSGAQTTLNWATGINAGPNESGQSLTFLVTGNTNPGLFSAGPSISDSGTLTYTPAANAYGTALVTLVLKDDGGTANGGQDTSATQTFTINVTPINDAPTFSKGPDQNVNEDPGFQSIPNWATGISAGPNESQSLTFLVTGNTNPNLFSFTPSVTTVGTLHYQLAANASGSAEITIVLKDGGETANGGQDTSGPQTFNINVTAVNDPPVNSVPFNQVTNQNTPRVFSTANFNAITTSDVDAGTNPVRTTLTATHGTLTIGSTTGITFVTGDGTDDGTMTFSGTVSAVNASLNGLTFKPDTDFSGAASIQITTDDQGHTGSGGAKTDTDTVQITVRAGGRVQFSSSTYQVNENTGIVTVTVTRTGGNSGSGSISYTTSNGTATGGTTCSSAGADYISVAGTFSWTSGDLNAKSFDIPFCGDSSNEQDETVNLTLSNPTGSITLGAPISSVLTILNDDMPVLLTVENTERAIALDLVTQMTEPFALTNPNNLSTDQQQRVSLFVWRLGLLPGDTAANITARAEDSHGGIYNLTVEYVSPVPEVGDVTQVVVRLPDSVVGAPRDLRITVTLRGPGSTSALIGIAGP